jgi:hypothetical protein
MAVAAVVILGGYLMLVLACASEEHLKMLLSQE